MREVEDLDFREEEDLDFREEEDIDFREEEHLEFRDKPFFKLGDAREYLNCAVGNLEATDKAVDRLSERITGLRMSYETNAGDKTNHRLAILTVLSAIFLPATFLVGYWGMNFDMPETHLPYSYPIAIGIIVLTGSSLFLFFWKKGWFD